MRAFGSIVRPKRGKRSRGPSTSRAPNRCASASLREMPSRRFSSRRARDQYEMLVHKAKLPRSRLAPAASGSSTLLAIHDQFGAAPLAGSRPGILISVDLPEPFCSEQAPCNSPGMTSSATSSAPVEGPNCLTGPDRQRRASPDTDEEVGRSFGPRAWDRRDRL